MVYGGLLVIDDMARDGEVLFAVRVDLRDDLSDEGLEHFFGSVQAEEVNLRSDKLTSCSS
jgi:hypothetical protein